MAESTTTTPPKSTTPPPPSGSAAPAKEPEHVESAPTNVAMKDALGKTPDEIQKEQAEASGETGPGGIALSRGEIAGGNIKKVLDPPPAESLANRPYVKEQAAMMTDTMKSIAPFMGRPPTEWGILGPGDVVKGHMILLDLNTGEKVRAADGHRIPEGGLYINARNIPESLSAGDTIDRVLGG